MKSYGITDQEKIESKMEFHIENIKLKGFSIEPGLLDPKTCSNLVKRLETVYSGQEKEFGKANMNMINEIDIARMPFMYDNKFIQLFTHPFVIELTSAMIGKNFHLHLQNGIINRPGKEHHQASWHRDLPYQDWTISKPLAVNAFYCLTDFTVDNGATFVLPYSHRSSHFPSHQFVKENELPLIASAGSVIFFDSMLYHRAGYNITRTVRIGINNMFVVPIIKQQVDIPQHFFKKKMDPKLAAILGLPFHTARDVNEFRNSRLKKLKDGK